MIDALFIFIVAIAHGVISAPDDTEAINTNKPIDHMRQWIGRALVALAVLLFFGRIGIPGALLYSGAWNVVFRYTLNRLRLPRRHWAYVSPFNKYDWQYIKRSLNWINKTNYREKVMEMFGETYGHPAFAEFTELIHRAGRLAYAVEASAAIAGAVMLIL